jgi:hypothetical protein
MALSLTAVVSAADVTGIEAFGVLFSEGGEPTCALHVVNEYWLVTDAYNNVIWRVNDQTGVVTVFAGASAERNYDGSAVSALKDGASAEARFGDLSAIIKYKSGYAVADRTNGAIRYIEAGQVTTFATGLGSPASIDADAKGNIYVADPSGDRIMKVDAEGNVSHFAGAMGGGYKDGEVRTAQFYGPSGVDWSGDALYIADSGNHCIRKIQHGVVTTVAGTVTGYAPSDGGYIDGRATHGDWFSNPTSVKVAPNGDLFVADTLNSAIRRVSRGKTTTVYQAAGEDVYPNSPGFVTLKGSTLVVADAYVGKVLTLEYVPLRRAPTRVQHALELYTEQGDGEAIEATWFSDVHVLDTYYKAVNYCVARGLMSAEGDAFRPFAAYEGS